MTLYSLIMSIYKTLKDRDVWSVSSPVGDERVSSQLTEFQFC